MIFQSVLTVHGAGIGKFGANPIVASFPKTVAWLKARLREVELEKPNLETAADCEKGRISEVTQWIFLTKNCTISKLKEFGST